MFTPFSQNCSPLGLAALRAQDPAWQAQAAEALLTGQAFAESYLLPLAASDLLADGLHEQTEVLAIGRDTAIKGELADDDQRADCDFRILLRTVDDSGHVHERVVTADAVIDATGTYANPNWLGQGGLPARGERAARPHIEYGLPDVLGTQRSHYAHRNVLLIGSGDSAVASLVALAELASQAPDTWITWLTRPGEGCSTAVTIAPDDPIVERRKLADRACRLASDDANHVTHWFDTHVDSITWHAGLERFSVDLAGKHPGALEFDRVVANVGYRGDATLYEELHVEHSGRTGGPITRNAGPVTAEPDFYVLGAKSAGRGSRFLIADGLNQIRRLFTIIGDREGLDLYQ